MEDETSGRFRGELAKQRNNEDFARIDAILGRILETGSKGGKAVR